MKCLLVRFGKAMVRFNVKMSALILKMCVRKMKNKNGLE